MVFHSPRLDYTPVTRLEVPALQPEPQLLYALPEAFTGRGYATEMARAVIAAPAPSGASWRSSRAGTR
jgi:hypothetical protein